MHTDFVVQAKCTIFWLNTGFRVYFDLYELDFFQVPKTTFCPLLLVLFRPICLNISMHTDFVVHAKGTTFWLNIGVREYSEMYVPHFCKNTYFKKKTLKNLTHTNQNVP